MQWDFGGEVGYEPKWHLFIIAALAPLFAVLFPLMPKIDPRRKSYDKFAPSYLLFQVMIHSQIAAERGAFTVDDVVQGICEKMVRRHPHVFGDRKVNSPEEALALWQEIKKREKSEKP